MIPQLYSADALGYPLQRIGGLYQTQSCTVTREINGEYALDLILPVNAAHWQDLHQGAVIEAIVDAESAAKRFVIASIRRDLGGSISVYAQHESYRYNSVMVAPFLNGGILRGAQWAFLQAASHVVNAPAGLQMNYALTSAATGSPHLLKPVSLRAYLLDKLVKDWGGEIQFEGDSISWVDAIGEDRGARIVYGGNLLKLSTRQEAQGFETAIYPYFGEAGSDTKPLVEIPGKILQYSTAASAPIAKVIAVDFTREFETVPTPEELLAEAQRYAEQNAVAAMPLGLDLSHVDQRGSVPIRLGDTVLIKCDHFALNEKRRVRKMVFDVLLERVERVELGDALSTFAGAMLNLK